MSPKLCFDTTHGHPLGGGHWWVEGYWAMLQAIRDAMPEGAMLTSKVTPNRSRGWFDGYLTWTWQHDGQVPAFMAVYGGAIQMFGRAYGGGETRSLALRMKAGQRLVFGEQIGWIGPEIINEGRVLPSCDKWSNCGWRLRRYFAAGEIMPTAAARGRNPNRTRRLAVEENWWVTTDAVLTGAWRLPTENKLVLMLSTSAIRPSPHNSTSMGASTESKANKFARPSSIKTTR